MVETKKTKKEAIGWDPGQDLDQKMEIVCPIPHSEEVFAFFTIVFFHAVLFFGDKLVG